MPTEPNPFRQGLDRQHANHVALTPLSLLNWAGDAFPDRLALIHGRERMTWRELRTHCRRFASVLQNMDIGEGDTVATLLSNTPPLVAAHFAVPMTGAVLNAMNTRLDAAMIAFILRHSQTKVLIVDREFSPVASAALKQLQEEADPDYPLPQVIDYTDPLFEAQCRDKGREPPSRCGQAEYAQWVAAGDADASFEPLHDEWDAIALNYTSGTTGDPKGVVVHHRGAYLNAIGNVLSWSLPRHPVYLWTLPMFHCNGWCFPWTLAAVAGVNVCLRNVDAALILNAIREHRVTHYCAAPIVHSMLISAPGDMRAGIDHPVACMVAGAAPPAAMIAGMEEMGFDLTHVYGLTEVYGPASACFRQADWADADMDERVRLNGRQGIRYALQEGLTVMNPETMMHVPADGETMGEVMFRGNIVMKGYLKNPKSTMEAFAGGWFHTGDLGVLEPDGYVRLKDRSKDIIISGGENISSIEVEDALYRHPAVAACAVVARPDPRWGETPLAFVELRASAQPADGAAEEALKQALIAHCRERLAHYKCPREVRFAEIPKTSTGKIQKHVLRQQVGSSSAIAGGKA